MKIIIPMAGEGKRFKEAGYGLPKPFIDIKGKPMIQRVIKNLLPLSNDFIFLHRPEHLGKFTEVLRDLTIHCQFILVPALTEGAACTVLLAEDRILRNESVLIANADQLVKYNEERFRFYMKRSQASIWLFGPEKDPKWSFAEVESNRIVRVAEKNPISEWATCGVYFWRHWGDYVDCAKEMITKDIRVNNEFYVCPVFNIAIQRGIFVDPFYVDKMVGLGTPEDLKAYEKSSAE